MIKAVDYMNYKIKINFLGFVFYSNINQLRMLSNHERRTRGEQNRSTHEHTKMKTKTQIKKL